MSRSEHVLRWWLLLVLIAGAAKAMAALAVALIQPGVLHVVNVWGVPVVVPLLVAVVLAVVAYLTALDGDLLLRALGALWAAGAWAFATAPLRAAEWPAGGWWWLLALVAPPAAAMLAAEIVRGGLRRLGSYAVGATVLGLIGSMANSLPAVRVAAATVYPALLTAAIASAWWAHQRRTA